MHRLLRFFGAAGAVLLGHQVLLVGAQVPAPVSVTVIDVAAVDADGKPVAGLTAADFEVRLSGVVQTVRSAAFLQIAPPQRGATALSAAIAAPQGRHTVTNAASGDRRVFVIVADDLSFAPDRGKGVLAAAERFIDALPATDFVGFTTTSGTGAVNPTVDRAPVHAALQKVTGTFVDPRPHPSPTGPALGIGEALDIVDRGDNVILKNVVLRECFAGKVEAVAGQRIDTLVTTNPCASDVRATAERIAAAVKPTVKTQLEAYAAVIDAMRYAPGIKHVLLLTDGTAVPPGAIASLQPIGKAAAESGVALSAIVEEAPAATPDPPRAGNPDPGLPLRRREDRRVFEAAVQMAAELTGGTFHRVTGSPDPFFQRVASTTAGLYRLTVELPAGTAAGREFPMAVSVSRPGVTLRSIRVAIAPAVETPALLDDRLRTVVATGQQWHAVPIQMAVAIQRSVVRGQIDAGVNIEIPSTVKGPITTFFGIVDEGGTVRSGKRVVDTPAEGNYRVSFSLPIVPGTHKVRFAVSDAAGNLGSIETSVIGRFASIGPFAASDVLTWWTDQAGKAQFLALEEIPASVETLNAALELYQGTGAAPTEPVKVKFEWIAPGQQTPAAEKEVPAVITAGKYRGEAPFPLGAIPAGTYTLRATVTVGTTVVGSTSTTLRKR